MTFAGDLLFLPQRPQTRCPVSLHLQQEVTGGMPSVLQRKEKTGPEGHVPQDAPEALSPRQRPPGPTGGQATSASSRTKTLSCVWGFLKLVSLGQGRRIRILLRTTISGQTTQLGGTRDTHTHTIPQQQAGFPPHSNRLTSSLLPSMLRAQCLAQGHSGRKDRAAAPAAPNKPDILTFVDVKDQTSATICCRAPSPHY